MPSVPTSFNFDSDQVAEVGQTECNYASAPTCVGGAHRRKLATSVWNQNSATDASNEKIKDPPKMANLFNRMDGHLAEAVLDHVVCTH